MEGESKYEILELGDIADIKTEALDKNVAYGVPLKLNSQNISTPATFYQAEVS